MLATSALSLAGHPLRAARLTYGLARSLPNLAMKAPRPRLPIIDDLLGRDSRVMLPSAPLRAPHTPFNKSITAHRRWAFRDIDLADVKKLKNAAGLTVNDVVMALCAGALRRWLEDHSALPEDPLVAAVPVSIRTEGQKLGNRVSTMLAPLPTNVADPAERMQLSHQAMLGAKEQHGALPADLLGDVTQFAAPALAGQAARLAARIRLVERMSPFNLIISNVPGPNVPLYYAGAKLVAVLPAVRDRGRPGSEHHGHELRREDVLRPDLGPRPRARPGRDGGLPGRRAAGAARLRHTARGDERQHRRRQSAVPSRRGGGWRSLLTFEGLVPCTTTVHGTSRSHPAPAPGRGWR